MIEESEALEKIIQSTPRTLERNVPVSESLGCFLVDDVRSNINLPQVLQSAVDGYALKVSDCMDASEVLKIAGLSVAGSPCNASLKSGEAFRVFTGSQIPEGCDAVVMQEDITNLPNESISVNAPVSINDNVRRIGEVLAAGQKITKAGSCIKTTTLGALVAGGVTNITVGSFPSIGIIVTGDELVDPHQNEILSHQIYESNGMMLQSSVSKLGVETIKVRRTLDDLREISTVFLKMKEWADIILIVGGISVGERDFVKKSLQKCGVDEIFWRVRMKPGKPLYYGIYDDHGQVFGLPGNTVSAYVCLQLFVRPAIRLRSGASKDDLFIEKRTALCGTYINNNTDRAHYICGKLSDGIFNPIGNQRSNNILALSQSNSLLRLEPFSHFQAGENVNCYFLPH